MTEVLYNEQFIAAAGLQRSRHSQKKSSVERMLEGSLNTSPTPKTAPSALDLIRSNNNNNYTGYRRVSVPEEKPAYVASERKKINNLVADSFVKTAGLQRTGNSRKMSTAERLLEESLRTSEDRGDGEFVKVGEVESKGYVIRKKSETESETSSRSPFPPQPNNQERKQSTGTERKTSVYKLKNIEAPSIVQNNRITSRTQNLFKQYEDDSSTRKADERREQTSRELREVQQQYKSSTTENEREIAEQNEERVRKSRMLRYSSDKSIMA